MDPKDTDIRQLIPQRKPILMVDELVDATENVAKTQLTIRPDNWFLNEQGQLTEPGLIEHMAQSASAAAGWKALQAGQQDPPVGFIGEVKRFICHSCPQTGSTLHTTVTKEMEVGDVTMVSCETRVGDELIASTLLKIAIEKS